MTINKDMINSTFCDCFSFRSQPTFKIDVQINWVYEGFVGEVDFSAQNVYEVLENLLQKWILSWELRLALHFCIRSISIPLLSRNLLASKRHSPNTPALEPLVPLFFCISSPGFVTAADNQHSATGFLKFEVLYFIVKWPVLPCFLKTCAARS